MTGWLRSLLLAAVFLLVGAFAASLWMELRVEGPRPLRPASGDWEGRPIRVEVLNGAGVDGLARDATERLRGLGFDVVYYGNAEEFGADSSLAIARIAELEPARRAADALGIAEVTRDPDENLYLDVTVILGSDWVGLDEGLAPNEGGWVAEWWARLVGAARRLRGG